MDGVYEMTEEAVSEQNVDVVEEAPVKKNPLLERFNKMPAETFRLPSNGEFYNNGELDDSVMNGEVQVYPMTTVDEITIRSPDMLFQGTAVEKIFKRCIPQVKRPMDLLSNDVDYLLICLRMVTYGSNLEINWKCPKCKEAKTEDNKEYSGEQLVSTDEVTAVHRRDDEDYVDNETPSYVVNIREFLQKTRTLDIEHNDKFRIKMKSGEVVKLRPSSFGDMIKIYQYDMDNMNTPEQIVDFIMTTLLSVIESVNGVRNKDQIREWLEHIKAPEVEELQQSVAVANDWGTSYEYKFTCKKCKHESEVEVPLNPVNFFTKPSV